MFQTTNHLLVTAFGRSLVHSNGLELALDLVKCSSKAPITGFFDLMILSPRYQPSSLQKMLFLTSTVELFMLHMLKMLQGVSRFRIFLPLPTFQTALGRPMISGKMYLGVSSVEYPTWLCRCAENYKQNKKKLQSCEQVGLSCKKQMPH